MWLYDDTYQLQKGSGGRWLQNGDYIQVMCVFDSMERESDTIIGLETHDEMCWHRFEYYPMQAGAKCEGPVWYCSAGPITPEAPPAVSVLPFGARATAPDCSLHLAALRSLRLVAHPRPGGGEPRASASPCSHRPRECILSRTSVWQDGRGRPYHQNRTRL